MKSTSRLLSILAVLSMAAYGCGDVTNPNNGDNDGGGGGGGDGGGGGGDATPAPDAFNDPCAGIVDYDDFWECAMLVACTVFSECIGPSLEIEDCLGAGNDLNLFDNYPVVVTEALFTEAIAAGTMTYDGTAAGACFEDVLDFECYELFSDGGPFDDCNIFNGQVNPNGNCFHEEECAGNGADCQQNQCGGSQDVCCVGQCQAAVPVGGSCNMADCEPGAFCRQGICQAGEAGDQCDGDYQCDEDHYCNGNGLCTADLPSGGVCTDDDECSVPQLCLGDDLPNSTMGNCGDAFDIGDSCDSFCLSFFTTHCAQPNPNALGTCQANPTEGEPCLPNGSCGAYFLECNTTTNLCEELPDIGEPCGQNIGQCGIFTFCSTEINQNPTGVCTAPQGTGSQCGWSSHCASGLCTMGQCMDYPGCFP
jgi:hypothetical protein